MTHSKGITQNNLSTPLVSVVVRTCAGRSGFLREAIESVLQQNYKRVELVVVEDGSSEAAPLIESIRDQSRSRIVYLPLSKVGRCTAGNVGLEAAQGEFVQFLDDDDLLFPQHLSQVSKALSQNAAAVAAYGVAYEVPTVVLSQSPLRYQELGWFVAHRQPFSHQLLASENFLPIQTVLFRRLLFKQCGGFDERLDFLEDWDLWRRYSRQGDFVFVDQLTSLYRVPGSPAAAAARQLRFDARCGPLRIQLRELADGSQGIRWREWLRQVVLTRPWLYGIYWHGRRMYYRTRTAR